jgi:2-oxo-4-hydroxy-4-carboxy-5-ureidoimidazoline decarboxylase
VTQPVAVSAALAAFNAAPAGEAGPEVARCCASRAFVAAIVAGRPYGSFGELSTAVDAEFDRLGWADIAEALSGHPRIGERAATGWSRAEQAGALAAPQAVADELTGGNRAYEQRFGHVFLICASGLSAAEMLARLRVRLASDPAAERLIVAGELRKITHQRMRKLLGG